MARADHISVAVGVVRCCCRRASAWANTFHRRLILKFFLVEKFFMDAVSGEIDRPECLPNPISLLMSRARKLSGQSLGTQPASARQHMDGEVNCA